MPRKAKPEAADRETQTEPTPATNGHGVRMPANKTDAVRMAIAAGFDTGQEGSAYIRSMYKLDISPAHFSSTKSRLKAGEATKVTIPRRRGRPRLADGVPSTPRAKPAPSGEGELLAAMEALKPMIAALGADKVKRLVDLIA